MTRAQQSWLICVAIGGALLLCSCEQQASEHASQKKTTNETTGRTVTTTRVVSQVLSREVKLPADLLSFRDVMIYPKVAGFIEWIGVDRGSNVKAGDLLIRMSAPELPAQTKQSTDQAVAAQEDASQIEQELDATRKQLTAAQAKAKASLDTYQRLKGAESSYAGIIAGNDLEIAQKTSEADAANVDALDNKVKALESQTKSFKNRHRAALQAANSSKDIQGYLLIKAAFDGRITERNVHEGSFVHPPATDTASIPLLRLQQLSLLRLVVPVPETEIGGVVPGATVKFTVSAFPGQSFEGLVRRVADSVDLNTRTMPVELDVSNNNGRLTPGMFAEVLWPVRRTQASLFVPQSSVTKTTERTFVARIKDGIIDWVDVKPGFSSDGLVEVFGDLREGDEVALRGTDELRSGSHVATKESDSKVH